MAQTVRLKRDSFGPPKKINRSKLTTSRVQKGLEPGGLRRQRDKAIGMLNLIASQRSPPEMKAPRTDDRC